jgi:hypothetical protein
MANEKIYTAKEAAIAVLAKAEEMLKSHALKKTEELAKGGIETHRPEGMKGVHSATPSKTGSEGHSGASKAQHKQNLSELKAMPKPNLTKHECSICKAEDLAKAELAKGETRHEKGVHQSFGGFKGSGTSAAGSKTKASQGMHMPEIDKDVRSTNSKKLGELKAMPKPNLTKAEPPGEIHPKEHMEGEATNPGKRVESQVPPGNNPHEKVEGNNPAWGTDPGTKGHIKLAHFIGHMSAKKGQAAKVGASQPPHAAPVAKPAMKSAAGTNPSLTKHAADGDSGKVIPGMKKGIALS